MHGRTTQVDVAVYNSVTQRKRADQYLDSIGEVRISGASWNITVTDGSDATAIARIMR